jgi:hypothetical protein
MITVPAIYSSILADTRRQLLLTLKAPRFCARVRGAFSSLLQSTIILPLFYLFTQHTGGLARFAMLTERTRHRDVRFSVYWSVNNAL